MSAFWVFVIVWASVTAIVAAISFLAWLDFKLYDEKKARLAAKIFLASPLWPVLTITRGARALKEIIKMARSED